MGGEDGFEPPTSGAALRTSIPRRSVLLSYPPMGGTGIIITSVAMIPRTRVFTPPPLLLYEP